MQISIQILDYVILQAMQCVTARRLADTTQPPNVRTAWLRMDESIREAGEIIAASLPRLECVVENVPQPVEHTEGLNMPQFRLAIREPQTPT